MAARRTEVPWTNHGTKRKPDLRGRVFHRGAIRRLGPKANGGLPIPSVERWRELEAQFRAEIDAERALATQGTVSLPSLGEWAGMTRNKRGTVVSDWPYKWPRKQRRAKKSIEHAAQSVRPFLDEWGTSRPDGITWIRAHDWLAGQPRNVRTYSAQLVDDYVREHQHLMPALTNPFRDHADLPDPPGTRHTGDELRVVSDEAFYRLLDAASKYRSDEHARIARALVLAMGTTCCRVGELLALRWAPEPERAFPYGTGTIAVAPSYVDLDRGRIWIGTQILDDGSEGPVKNDDRGWIVLPPVVKDELLALPRVSDYVFPGPSGKRMKPSQWSGSYWSAIRSAAGLPDLTFYELKHRAITWICTPPDPKKGAASGLGLDPITAAVQARHRDGGLTIVKHYLRLDTNAALDRIQRAMADQFAGHPSRSGVPCGTAVELLEAALAAGLDGPAHDMVRGALGYLTASAPNNSGEVDA